MVKKSYLAILAVFAVGLTGTVAFADVPDHVDLPEPTERAAAFQPVIAQTDEFTAIFMPIMTTTNDPSGYLLNQSGGSALLHFISASGSEWGCSGTLIADNKILTAGHCVANSIGVVDAQSGMAYFDNVQRIPNQFAFTGTFEYEIIDFTKHSKFDGKFLKGYDIAIVTIKTNADASIPRITIDGDDSDTVGQKVDVIGYGVSGFGATGFDSALYPYGTHRNGENTIDAYGDTMYSAIGYKPNKDYKRGAVIQSDFDNGLSANDAFGEFFGISHPGIGDNEVKVCSGDSGGGIRNANGDVTGVNSYSINLTWNNGDPGSDVTPALDCSFGEFTGYTNVPYHADWIDSQLGSTTTVIDTFTCDGKKANHPKCQ